MTDGARKLAEWRSKAGLTYEEAGAKFGRSREWVRRVEAGHVVPVKMDTIEAMRRVAGIAASAWVKP